MLCKCGVCGHEWSSRKQNVTRRRCSKCRGTRISEIQSSNPVSEDGTITFTAQIDKSPEALAEIDEHARRIRVELEKSDSWRGMLGLGELEELTVYIPEPPKHMPDIRISAPPSYVHVPLPGAGPGPGDEVAASGPGDILDNPVSGSEVVGWVITGIMLLVGGGLSVHGAVKGPFRYKTFLPGEPMF